MKWRPEHVAEARRLLEEHRSIPLTLRALSQALGRTITLDSLDKALRRAGEPSATTILRNLQSRTANFAVTSDAPLSEPVAAAGPVAPPAVEPPPPPPRPAPAPSRGPHISDARIFVCVSDVHVPGHDRAATRGVMDYAADLRPHGLIFNGDVLDLEELGRWNAGSLGKLEGKRVGTSFAEANAFIDDFQRACGSRLEETHWINGNHENRLDRWLMTGDNAVFAGEAGLTLSERLHFARRGIVDHGEYPRAHVKLGHLIVTHGVYTGKYAASRHLDMYRCSVVVGHVHTPGVFYGAGFKSQQVCVVGGHLADVTASCMSYAPQPNSWCQAFTVIHVRKSGTFQINLVPLWDRAFMSHDKLYGGVWREGER